MSTILNALKKIEGRKVDKSLPAWPFGSGSLESMDHHIYRSRRRQKILGSLILICLLAVAGKLYIGSRPASNETASTSTPLPVTAQSTQPTEVVKPESRKSFTVKSQSVPEPETSPREPSREELPPREPSSETILPSKVPSAPAETAPAHSIEEASSETATPSAVPPTQVEPSETAAVTEAPPTAVTEVFGSPPADNAGLSLMALVWSKQPESRFVVINGSIVREGGTIEESTVIRIEETYAVLRTGGVVWKLK